MKEEVKPSQPKMALWKKIVIGCVVLAAIGKISTLTETTEENANGRTKQKLTMAYVVATRHLKEGLKDPESYEEISHKEYYDAGPDSLKNNIQVVIDYRAKNSLGGYVIEKKAFDFDSTGMLLDTYSPK